MSNVCSRYDCCFQLCYWLNSLPFGKEYTISKDSVPELPKCFEETLLGEPKGAVKQFRGPYESHVREYDLHWEFHRDKADPRIDMAGHIVNDAPYLLPIIALIGLGALLVVSSLSHDNKE